VDSRGYLTRLQYSWLNRFGRGRTLEGCGCSVSCCSKWTRQGSRVWARHSFPLSRSVVDMINKCYVSELDWVRVLSLFSYSVKPTLLRSMLYIRCFRMRWLRACSPCSVGNAPALQVGRLPVAVVSVQHRLLHPMLGIIGVICSCPR